MAKRGRAGAGTVSNERKTSPEHQRAVAMDAFGPIADNANGIGEVAGMPEDARQIMADLDAAGNTTKAITKGIAIGSAVIAAVALFGSFLTDTRVVQLGLGVPPEETLYATGINIADPLVFIGFLLGGGVIFLFSSLLKRFNSRLRSTNSSSERVRG